MAKILEIRNSTAEFLTFLAENKEDGVMLCYVENACHFTYDYGDMWEQYYTSVENNFDKTMAFIAKNNLLEQFKSRL